MDPARTYKDQLIDNPGAVLGIAEATLNNAHRDLIGIEIEMKMGLPLNRVRFGMLRARMDTIEANYEDAVSNLYPGAESREPAFVEREEE